MPTIRLNRPHSLAPGWRSFHPRFAWDGVDLTENLAGYSVQRTDSPPPPAPKLDIILLHGNCNATVPIGRRFAQDLGQGFIHIDIYQLLCEVNALPDGKQKTQALGLLHFLPLERYINRESKYLSTRLIVEQVLLRHIDNLVSTGARRFIITGSTDFHHLYHINIAIARPDAVIWLEEPAGWDAKGWLRGFFGEGRCILLDKEGYTCLEDLYDQLLVLVGEKAGLRARALERNEIRGRNGIVGMDANAALRKQNDSSHAVGDDEMLLDDVYPSSSALVVKREDTPMVETQAGYDVAMDLLQELEEYAKSGLQHA